MNKVELTGRLTKRLELRKTETGKSVVSFTLAVNKQFKPKNDQGPTADFVSCVAWNGSADFLASYADKGTRIGLEGRIQTRNYQNQQGQTIYITEVVADRVEILNSPQGNNSQQKQQTQAPEDHFSSTPNIEINSDDLPFY